MQSFKKFALIPYGEYLKHHQLPKQIQMNPNQVSTTSQPIIHDNVANQTGDIALETLIPNPIHNTPTAVESGDDPLKLASKIALENFVDECDGRVFDDVLHTNTKSKPKDTTQNKGKSKPKQPLQVDDNRVEQKNKKHKVDQNIDTTAELEGVDKTLKDKEENKELKRDKESKTTDFKDTHNEVPQLDNKDKNKDNDVSTNNIANVKSLPVDIDSDSESNSKDTKVNTVDDKLKDTTRRSGRTIKIKKYPSHLWLTGQESG